MDSLTQITLGAAVGELALGRKIGNRAMVWGAIGGTIPDLDVFANLVTDEISAMAFHRALTHSIFFSIVAPLILAWLLVRFYERGRRRRFGLDLLKAGGVLWVLLFVGSLNMPIPTFEILMIALVVTLAILFFPALLYLFKRKKELEHPPNFRGWFLLFFLSILTHPLLDSCTAFGTQLFQPFSDYRVAWNNIAVADPLYTFPFLFFLIWASRKAKASKTRKWLNYIGIIVSSGYMLWTVVNKVQVDRIFAETLKQEQIQQKRFTTSPSILNNILWQGVAEGDSLFYYGRYSLWDQKKAFLNLNSVEKGHEYLKPYENDRTIRILKWFSNGYYCVEELSDGSLQFNDLRYGTFPVSNEEEVFIFRFLLHDENGQIKAEQRQPDDQNMGEAFQRLWDRIKGI